VYQLQVSSTPIGGPTFIPKHPSPTHPRRTREHPPSASPWCLWHGGACPYTCLAHCLLHGCHALLLQSPAAAPSPEGVRLWLTRGAGRTAHVVQYSTVQYSTVQYSQDRTQAHGAQGESRAGHSGRQRVGVREEGTGSEDPAALDKHCEPPPDERRYETAGPSRPKQAASGGIRGQQADGGPGPAPGDPRLGWELERLVVGGHRHHGPHWAHLGCV